jgi:hypothetical protein
MINAAEFYKWLKIFGVGTGGGGGGTIEAVYAETNFQSNGTLTPIAAVSTPVQVAATYASGELFGFSQVGGVLTFLDEPGRTMRVEASLTTTLNLNTASLSFFIYKNGAPVAKSTMTPTLDGFTPSPKSVSISCLLEINTNDQIAIYVQNNTNTEDVLIQDLNMQITSIGGIGGTATGVLNLGTVILSQGFGGYLPGVFQPVYTQIAGTNVIPAGSFEIGQTIEIDCLCNITAQLNTLPNVQGQFSVNFGSTTINRISKVITFSAIEQKAAWLKAKITRGQSGDLLVGVYGNYIDQSNNEQALYENDSNGSYAYNPALDQTLSLNWRIITGDASNQLFPNIQSLNFVKYT